LASGRWNFCTGVSFGTSMGASLPNCTAIGFGGFSSLVGSAGRVRRSTTGLATGPPLVVISSVFDLASRATRAQREESEMLPMLMAYSAHEPTSIFCMSTTSGMPAGTPGACARAREGIMNAAKTRRKKDRMESPVRLSTHTRRHSQEIAAVVASDLLFG